MKGAEFLMFFSVCVKGEKEEEKKKKKNKYSV